MLSTLFTSLLSIFFLPSLLGVSPVTAASGDALSGYAWSPNAGWISFNCTNESCGSTNYGVTADSGSPRILSGYAWSSAVGWISFNGTDLSGCPQGACTARMDTVTGKLSGWAKAISANDAESGGWEGWISLSGSTYGVLANGTKWTGYAWGGGPVTGTGVFSPKVGGNANIGWISFRGVTTEAVPVVYGVEAQSSSNAVGPRSIACGVNMAVAPNNSTVTWTVVVDSSKIPAGPSGAYWYDWYTTGGVLQGKENHSSDTRQILYNTTGLKTAWVKVIADGVTYIVDCDAASLAGAPSPWYPDVLIGFIDLGSTDTPDTPTGLLQAEVGNANFGGSNTDVRCIGCDAVVQGPFDNVFQIIVDPSYQGSTAPLSSRTDGVFITAVPTVDSVALGEKKYVTGAWSPIPSTTCDGMTTPCKAWFRVCADHTVSPSFSFDGAVCESNETSCVGTTANCSPWSSFSIAAPPPPPLGGGTCKAIPAAAQIGSTVVWTVTGVTGGAGTNTYTWAFPDGTPSSGTGANANTSYTTFGNKTASVTVSSEGAADYDLNCTGIVRVTTLEEF